jgi:hypothetical protein
MVEEGIAAAALAFLVDDGPEATAMELNEDRRKREINRRSCMKTTDDDRLG